MRIFSEYFQLKNEKNKKEEKTDSLYKTSNKYAVFMKIK